MCQARLRQGDDHDLSDILTVHLRANQMFAPTGLVPASEINRSLPASFVADCLRQGCVQVASARAVTGEEAVVGFAMCRAIGECFYLDQISVDPRFGQQGIGSALLKAVIRRADELGLGRVTLSTFRDLAWNGPFYRRHGFREIPRHRLSVWMHDIEAAQALTMDITKRCFMQRAVGGVLRLRPARVKQAA